MRVDENNKPIFQHQALGPDGLGEVGSRIFNGQVFANKCVPTNSGDSTLGAQQEQGLQKATVKHQHFTRVLNHHI